MATEIERKFLVQSTDFLSSAVCTYHIEQAYLSISPTIRLRVRDEEAFLTIKTPSLDGGLSRNEWEYAIPLSEAREMMLHALGRPIIKRRHIVPYAGHIWEVDVFGGELEGLVLAEIELERVDEVFALPPWLGREVSGDAEYYNSHLALIPS